MLVWGAGAGVGVAVGAGIRVGAAVGVGVGVGVGVEVAVALAVATGTVVGATTVIQDDAANVRARAVSSRVSTLLGTLCPKLNAL